MSSPSVFIWGKGCRCWRHPHRDGHDHHSVRGPAGGLTRAGGGARQAHGHLPAPRADRRAAAAEPAPGQAIRQDGLRAPAARARRGARRGPPRHRRDAAEPGRGGAPAPYRVPAAIRRIRGPGDLVCPGGHGIRPADAGSGPAAGHAADPAAGAGRALHRAARPGRRHAPRPGRPPAAAPGHGGPERPPGRAPCHGPPARARPGPGRTAVPVPVADGHPGTLAQPHRLRHRGPGRRLRIAPRAGLAPRAAPVACSGNRERGSRVSRRGWVLFAMMSVIWGVPYLLIKVADTGVSVPVLVFARVAIGSAVLLIAVVPIIGLVLARATGGRERLTAARWSGLLAGLGGVALLAGPHLTGGGAWPVTEVILVALCYATGPLIANRKLGDLPGLGMTAACLAATALVYAPAAALSWPARPPSAAVLGSLAGLGVLCTALAFVLFFQLIAEVGPARATVITYVNPAVAVALGVGVLGEPLTPAIAAAFVLILSGSVLATRSGRPRPRLATDNPHAPAVREARPQPDPGS